MRSARTTSFRLHNINKSNSVRRQSYTAYGEEPFKLAAINSVGRSVKYNDISFLTGAENNKLRKEPIESTDRYIEFFHASLAAIRRKHDEARKARIASEQTIDGLKVFIIPIKDVIEKFNIITDECESKVNEGNSQVKTLETTLEDKKNHLYIVTIDRKVLGNMEQRHKIDKVCYDQRKFTLNKDKYYLYKQLYILQKAWEESSSSKDRAGKVGDKLQQQIDSELKERTGHLQNMEDMISYKKRLIEMTESRGQEINSIAEQAMQEKDSNEKQWIRVLLLHKFVHRLLCQKIDREMNKFSAVEFAFKTIKTATGVNDARTLVAKYLNKDAVYGELLGKISENEHQMQELQAKGEHLLREQKELENEKDILISTKIHAPNLTKELKAFEQFSIRLKDVSTKEAKLGSWLRRNIKKFTSFSSSDSPNQSFTRDNFDLKRAFTHYLETLAVAAKEASEMTKIEAPEPYEMTSKELQKIVRIPNQGMPKQISSKEQSPKDEYYLSSALNNEYTEIINEQYDEIIANNERFMRELKRKKEYLRKTLIDKSPYKKEKVAKPVEPIADDS